MKHKKGKVKKQGEQYVVQDLETGNILPLKFSQIQSAIDNGEVDSDKVVEFEIVPRYLEEKDVNSINGFAKIIPQKKRMYTEEEVEELLLKICRLQNDKLTTAKDISAWLKNNAKGEIPVT